MSLWKLSVRSPNWSFSWYRIYNGYELWMWFIAAKKLVTTVIKLDWATHYCVENDYIRARLETIRRRIEHVPHFIFMIWRLRYQRNMPVKLIHLMMNYAPFSLFFLCSGFAVIISVPLDWDFTSFKSSFHCKQDLTDISTILDKVYVAPNQPSNPKFFAIRTHDSQPVFGRLM